MPIAVRLRLVVFLLLFSIASATAESHAGDRFWNAGNGVWSNAFHWTPVGVPSPIDVAHIGNIGGDQDWEVLLDQNDFIAGLEISNHRDLDTNGNILNVTGNTLVDGSGTLLAVEFANNAPGFSTHNLTVSNGGLLRGDFGGKIDVGNLLTIDASSTLSGTGTVRLYGNGAKSLSLDGGFWTGSSLAIHQIGSGLIDLDGSFGDSDVTAASAGVLTVNGTSLHDPFDGDMNIGRDSQLNMNLSNGWDLGTGGRIRFAGSFVAANSGLGQHLQGSHVTVAGQMLTDDDNGDANIHSDATLTSTAQIDVYYDSRFNFQGATNIDGGTYAVGQDALLNFYGDTSIMAGTFQTHSSSLSDGGTYFRGPTTWSGNATINGAASQTGDATISATTTIQAETFDMDGVSGNTTWDIDVSLTIQADRIDATNNTFNGIMNVAASLFSNLNVQLTNPDQAWQMKGALNLGGNVAFSANRVSGNQVEMNGTVDVNSRVGITADTVFGAQNSLSLNSVNDELTMKGLTRVEDGAAFSGSGTLINHNTGTMVLEHGAGVNVDVRNDGVLAVGNEIGQATVKRLDHAAAGTLQFHLSGTTPGTEYSQLVSSSNVALQGGTLDIMPLPAYQDPDVLGSFDEFVLVSSNFLSGEFDSVVYDATELDWEFTSAETSRSHEGDGLFRIVGYTADEVQLVNYRALLGDANGDGTVDGVDFIIWNDHKFTSGNDWTTGDFNGDGFTDGLDYVLWNTNKFTSIGNFDLTAVPEPSAALLTMLSCVVLAARRLAIRRTE